MRSCLLLRVATWEYSSLGIKKINVFDGGRLLASPKGIVPRGLPRGINRAF